jgi:hypothetical protein
MDRRVFLQGTTATLGMSLLGEQMAQARQNGGKNHAVVIGVPQYRYNIAPLPSPALDVVHFVHTLDLSQDNLTILVNGVSNAEDVQAPTKRNIEAAIKSTAEKVRPEDTFWLYFSGHGVAQEGRSYLVPEDARASSTDSLVSVTMIRQVLEKSVAKRKILIIDACQSGATKSALKPLRWENVLEGSNGIITMAACQINQYALVLGGDVGGLFTAVLTQGLVGGAASANKEAVTFGALKNYVSQTVHRISSGRQTPVFIAKANPETPIGRYNTDALSQFPSLANQTMEVREPLKPGLIVWIQEEQVDVAGGISHDSMLLPLVQNRFVKDSFPVVIEEDAKNFRVRLSAVDMKLAGLAVQKLNSRFLIRGTAKVKPVVKKFAEQADYETVEALVKVQALDETGMLLGSLSFTETGRGNTEQRARDMAMKSAAERIHSELRTKLKEALGIVSPPPLK